VPYIHFEDHERRVMVCEHLTEENKPIMDSICDACNYHRQKKNLMCRHSFDEEDSRVRGVLYL